MTRHRSVVKRTLMLLTFGTVILLGDSAATASDEFEEARGKKTWIKFPVSFECEIVFYCNSDTESCCTVCCGQT